MLLSKPKPVLNEEERVLLTLEPEKCLRSIVQRGALLLDEITEQLSPRAAAVVRAIAADERLPEFPSPADDPLLTKAGPSEEQPRYLEEKLERPPTPDDLERMREAGEIMYQLEYATLSAYPHLQRMVNEKTLTFGEAMGAANTIDRALGRYLTGTKYAAP